VIALSPTAGAALAALLLASMGRAFLGPPAPRPRRAAARGLLVATAGCYVAGAAVVVLARAPLPGVLFVAGGIEASCLGAWLVRGDDDSGPGGDDRAVDPPPWDWEAFDRARAQWGRRRAGV
jgi:hypothetical protein